MMRIIQFTIFACTLFVCSQVSASADAKIYYSVDAAVTIDGHGVMTQKAIALANNPVRAELDGKSPSPSYRLEYTVTPVVGKEDRQAVIHLSFFDMSMGNWVLRAQPSAVVRLGQEATISLPYHDGQSSSRLANFRITLSQVEEKTLLIKFHGNIPNPSLCPSDASAKPTAQSLRSLGINHTELRQPACCSASCNDGSGNTLSCCGAVSCSGCGASCSPQS